MYLNFLILMSVYAAFPSREDKTLVEGAQSVKLQGWMRRRGDLGCALPRLQKLVPGCQDKWRLLLSAVVFSFIQPSKRTPFRGGLVDGRRRRRSRVDGEGRGGVWPTIVTPIGKEV